MDAETKWSVKLTNGETIQYCIIGINHDDLADGSGKAGLTFLTTSSNIRSRMNATETNAGGWEKSELRQKMNSGEIWSLMPIEFQSKVKAVKKFTNNVGDWGTIKNANVTATVDKLFLLSRSEIFKTENTPYINWSDYSWIGHEGFQYEVFKDKVQDNGDGYIDFLRFYADIWMRSVSPLSPQKFSQITYNGGVWENDYGGVTNAGDEDPYNSVRVLLAASIIRFPQRIFGTQSYPAVPSSKEIAIPAY